MSIIAAYMVPHPPMIIPQIGRGNEKQIQETIDAYRNVAREIATLKPETIIISSPHSVMYSDYFHISPGKNATEISAIFMHGKFDSTKTMMKSSSVGFALYPMLRISRLERSASEIGHSITEQ